MIISRIVARRRIAAGIRPSFKAAWLPVAADILIISLLLASLFNLAVTLTLLLSLFWRILTLMLVIYAPLQIVIIVSTIWAVRSRWEEKETK